MKIQPCGSHLLIEMHDIPTDSKVALPSGVKLFPHGVVVALGPDCKTCAIDDKVLFLPDNLLGFEHPTAGKQYILPEGCVLAKYVPDATI